jgi:hypothetical protein
MWVGISGGWRRTNEEIELFVRNKVSAIMSAEDGIVSGGALGVDSIALDEALKYDPNAERIKIFIPTTLETYSKHYRNRAEEGVITQEQAERLVAQLSDLRSRNPAALIENPKNTVLNDTTYYERNSAVINASDRLLAFHITSSLSKGLGTMDTVNKARQKGIPVEVYSFNLE